MANYKTHSVFNLFLALPVLLVGIYYFLHPQKPLLLTFIASFCYTTLFMNPDLDLAHQIKFRSLRGILSLPFRGYSLIFKHRGISHSIIFGSLTRILWLAGLALLLFFLIFQTLPSERHLMHTFHKYHLFIYYGFAGICLADWGHLLLDIKPPSR